MPHSSIADITEADFIMRLLLDPYWRSRVFNIYGMPSDPSAFASVDLGGAPGNPRGDVDVLLCPKTNPELATAVSVKRIKFGAKAVRDGKPNKLGELKKAVDQANLLASVGFHLVFSFVFVAVDTREQNAGTQSFAGLSNDLKLMILNVVTPERLDPRVGLYRTEYVQPVDDAPLLTGSFSGHLVRNAKPLRQANELTSWVAEVINQKRPIEPVSVPSLPAPKNGS